jgi:hypothetical protein
MNDKGKVERESILDERQAELECKYGEERQKMSMEYANKNLDKVENIHNSEA